MAYDSTNVGALANTSEPPALSQQPGTIVEKEGDIAPESSTVQYGTNFERLAELSPQISAALHDLVYQFNQEDLHARRDEVKRIRLAREFWKGLHYLYWDEETQNWELPFQVAGQKPKDSEELPRYSYVTNFYQAFGLSIIAVFSKKPPNVKLWPQSARQPEDVATAKIGSDIVDVIKKNNRVAGLFTELAWYLYVDGSAAGYVRYVVDGDRFGYHKEDQIVEQLQKIEPDRFVCPECGAENPVEGTPRMINLCASCGEYMGDDDLIPGATVPVPVKTGQIDMPNGQEEITIIGKLELKIPSWATRFVDFPYLQWQTEIHTSKLRAIYKHAAKQIKVNTGAGASLGSETHERETRLSLKSGTLSAVQGDPSSNLITFTRTWIRPWAFYLLDDDAMRDQLLQLFPKGCYVAFASDTYCESRNESMNDKWRILHAYPGDGQSRPAMGDSIIPINKRFNDLSNIQQETYEFGIPPTYMDNRLLDRQAVGTQKCLPGSFYFVTGRPAMTVRDGIYTPPPSQVAPDMLQSMADLMGPVAQFLTGSIPALWGGEMESNETAAGISIARDAAMGRLGLVWEAIKEFWSDLMMLGIECFRKNRSGDLEIPLEGKGGKWNSKYIKEADLKGNLFATAELDETFPQMYSQLRATVMQLMESQDPYVQEIMGNSANVKMTKRLLGLDQYVVPDEDSETKQYREIEMMLQSQPTIAPGEPITDEATGEPQVAADGLPQAGPPKFVASVPVDPLVDDHETEAEVCRTWLNSDEGQLVKYENAMGYMNVRAHLEAHEQQVEVQQLKAMMMAPSVESSGSKKQAQAGGGK
jgi:hypothetical protein